MKPAIVVVDTGPLIALAVMDLAPPAVPLLNRLLEHGYHLDKSLFQYVVNTCGESL